MTTLKTALRPTVAFALRPLVGPLRPMIQRARDGSRLKPGIAASVTARNESYTVGWSLRSLLGLSDQIVCIDNGSDDDTRDIMKTFADEHADEVDIEVLFMPEATFAECCEEALRRTKRQWHLQWDADFVAHTEGRDRISELRRRVLERTRLRTIRLPYTNLYGDLRHTQRLAPVYPGEPYLVSFGRDIAYASLGGKYEDEIRVPRYYAQEGEATRFFFHLGGVKTTENLMHRFHFFPWRAEITRAAQLGAKTSGFEEYRHSRNVELFGTDDPRSVKFRYERQLSYHMGPYEVDRYGGYPALLSRELSKPRQRFEVVYREGRPWSRVDHEDDEMRDYEPTAADLDWDPEAFLRRFLTGEQCRTLGVGSGLQTS